MYYLLKTMNKQDAKSFETLKKKKKIATRTMNWWNFYPNVFVCVCLMYYGNGTVYTGRDIAT